MTSVNGMNVFWFRSMVHARRAKGDTAIAATK